MKHSLIILLFFSVASAARTQECQVKADSLMGTYSGGCKNGLAEGTGTATGTDTYTGSFRKGWPEGEGKYTWKNGSCYEGSWKHGKRDGKGTYQTTNTGNDSVTLITAGYWKDDKYTGNFLNPYNVELFTTNVSEFSIRKLNSTTPEITINVKSVTGGASNLFNPSFPKTRLINIEILEGKFEQRVNDENSSKFVNNYTLKQVTFPFHAIFSFETENAKRQVERVGVEILESANWYIHAMVEN